MAFGTDRRRLGVDNLRVVEASCAAGRLRGESRPVPRSRIRKRRCRAWHDGESHANLDLRNESLDIGRKTRLAGLPGKIHINDPLSVNESPNYQISEHCQRRINSPQLWRLKIPQFS